IAPTIVAARIGEPVRVRNVRPAVIRGTVGVTNAVELSAEETVKRTERVRSEIVEGKETIEAAEKVPPPEALKKGEVGRVGERAPRVAKEAQIAPGTVTEKDAPEPEIGTKAKPDSDAKIGPDTKKVDPEMKKAEPETKVDPDTKKPEPETK